MTDRSYDVVEHRQQALRMVYQARANVAHLDAAVIGPAELEMAKEAMLVLEQLEQLLEERIDRSGSTLALAVDDAASSTSSDSAPVSTDD